MWRGKEGRGMVQVSQTFSSDLGQLAALRGLVRRACEQAWGGAGAEALDDLELAVQEAATNIIRHAYLGKGGQPVEVVVEAGPDAVCVVLAHRGASFDPARVPPPSFDGSRAGGFGVYIIQRLVDEVVYSHDADGRCTIRLVKSRMAVERGDMGDATDG
jgi:serine/threonine-protein kinase RsbW